MNERDGAIPFQFRLWQTTLSSQAKLPTTVIDPGSDFKEYQHDL